MPKQRFCDIVDGLAIIGSSAFAGSNLFIGLSVGLHWLRLDPLDFAFGFWDQFVMFTLTIMPLFTLTLVGLVCAAKRDWNHAHIRRSRLSAITCFVIVSLITVVLHVPINLALRTPQFTASEASAIRLRWLVGHVPRILLTGAVAWFTWRACAGRFYQSVREES
ncbi:MAG: hypothetical protein AAGI53_01510 [Planctomycetota bacterium]